MLVDEPDRRRGRWRAEDHVHPPPAGQIDAAIKPFEAELAGVRLEREPRELAHVHDLQPHRRHAVDVALPLFLGPLLGVVVGADFHFVHAR